MSTRAVVSAAWRSPDGNEYKVVEHKDGRLLLYRWYKGIPKNKLLPRRGYFRRHYPRMRTRDRLISEARIALKRKRNA